MYKVANKHRRQVRKTLHSLGKAVVKANEAGHPVPELDLATLKVPGTDLFCTGNKGIPRIQMPQLKGFPLPGSIASQFKAAKSGKIDFSDVFLTRLRDAGLETKRYQFNPTKLKSTQSQLQGSKIALQLRELEADHAIDP